MKIFPKKLEPASPTSEAIRQALAGRISALSVRHAELLRESIKLTEQRLSSFEIQPRPDISEISKAYIAAEPVDIPETGSPIKRLAWLRVHIEAISAALETLTHEDLRLYAPHVGEVMAELGSSWTAITRRRAQALIDLRKANVDAREFRRALKSRVRGEKVPLKCDFEMPALLFGGPTVGDPVSKFLNEVVKAGILTEDQVRDAANPKRTSK